MILLRSKDLYEKTCRECGLIFRTDKPKAYICPTCQKIKERAKSYRQEAKRKETEKDKPLVISLIEKMRVIEKYNSEHKTSYTYGQFEELIRRGDIKIAR